jgi:serine/threonine protein kinase
MMNRYRIIMGVGKALGYLHGEHCGTKYVVHGDIKPSNIMLDEELNAKLGDFGLARLVDRRAAAQTTDNVMGTQGYIEPEFVQTGKRCKESDVYSFGIVLLEMVTGIGPWRRPLRSWVWELYGQNLVLEAASATLRSESNDWQMERVLVVGLWCTHPVRSERPSIAHAMRVLEHADLQFPTLTPNPNES